MLNDQGVVVRTLGMIQDITERKQLEERLEFLSCMIPSPACSIDGHWKTGWTMNGLVPAAGHQLSVFMLDLDYFKNINDTHGHEVGDTVLKRRAAAKHGARFRLRFGGEEFIVLLPETGLEKAGELAERLREAIASHSIKLKDDSNLQVTASIGIAAVDKATESWEKLIGQADKALYRQEQRQKSNPVGQ